MPPSAAVQSFDMLNKYGDQVVGQYLADNPALLRSLGLEAGVDTDGKGIEDIARKATGRLALQSIRTQEAFYAEVEGQYSALINYLNEGLTTANRKASLKERYRIMANYYGQISTALNHLWFAMRAVVDKIKRQK